MFVHCMHAWCPSGPLELELWMVMRRCVGLRDEPRSFASAFNQWLPLLTVLRQGLTMEPWVACNLLSD